MIKQQLVLELQKVLQTIGIEDLISNVSYSAESRFGDYASNVAMVVAKKVRKSPMVLAEEIADKFKIQNSKFKVEVVKPGFINFWVSNSKLLQDLYSLDIQIPVNTQLSNKKVMVEFAHPNTHKAFHIGHLRNIVTGESIVRLLESAGVEVIRANYQGDVGMHIAKCIHGLTMLIGEGEKVDQVLSIVKVWEAKELTERMTLLGQAYAYGNKLFEENKISNAEIKQINSAIYNGNWEANAAYKEVYQITRKWSLDYFEKIYKRVDSHFNNYYFESETYKSGRENVLKGLDKKIFQKSDGAIIFPGSKFGLHDRVFITSEGNPTYEGKDMGLGPLQFSKKPDLIIHVVGPEQAAYFQVVFEALAQLFPYTRGKEFHLIYGWVKLKHGKMSSRTGNVILGEWLLDEAKKKVLASYDIPEEVAEQIAVGAVKYSFLKVGLNQEIAFDLDESISLEGNSGPYLQYTYVRTQSVLNKSQISNLKSQKFDLDSYTIQTGERELLRLLVQFPEQVAEAAEKYSPHVLCSYLFELAQAFNLFYQKYPILKEEKEVREFRLFLTQNVGDVIKQGLHLLGIQAPEKM